MKRTLLIWLLVCLLLVGCGTPQADLDTTAPAAETTTAPTTPAYHITPGGSQEEMPETVPVMRYLSIPGCFHLAPMGQDILICSEGETGTVLTLLSGTDMAPIAQRDLDVSLLDQLSSIQTAPQGVAYFEEGTREMVLLDEALREITRISAPEGLSGLPVMAEDLSTLYYCTDSAICAMDLETRLPRVLRQYSGEPLILDGVYMDGTVLKCSRYDTEFQTLFLDAENGQLLAEKEGWYDFASWGQDYITSFWQESYNNLVFGTGDSAPQALYLPGTSQSTCLLGRSHGILNILADEALQLNYYDLSSGTLASTFFLDTDGFPMVADGGDGILWLLLSDELQEDYTLYRWDTATLPTGSTECFTDTYYSRTSPDLAGIAACQETARALSEKHGVEILVWEDALSVTPWDFTLTEEYLVPVLENRLNQLDKQLDNFPEGFFQTLTEDFSGLTISLVRQLKGNTDTGAIADAAGLQYWDGNHAYIALSTVDSGEGNLYHELCHVLDTRIFSQSNAYDQWESLNPNGFEYDYDYIANADRNAGEYLRDAERCFIDTYSMSFPKEDRARILEYAMTGGNGAYFQSQTMQSKLRHICIGIREAFGLKKSPEAYLWEQYLSEPLAYSK